MKVVYRNVDLFPVVEFDSYRSMVEFIADLRDWFSFKEMLLADVKFFVEALLGYSSTLDVLYVERIPDDVKVYLTEVIAFETDSAQKLEFTGMELVHLIEEFS